MDWNLEILEKSLAGKLIGHKVYYYPEIGSTNDEAYRLGVDGVPEGSVVIAESQTKGKGRNARSWYSPAGLNIYTSVILRPPIAPSAAPQISLVAGVAVAEQLERYCAGRVKLKWPNDILLTGKKVCGILAEMKTAADSIDFVIIGIGLNVNMQLHQFPVEIQTIATSLREVIGYEIPRQELIIGIYENMTKWYKQFLEDGFEPIRKKWLEYSAMAGQRVQVVFRDKKICGEALGIDEQGSLILLDKNGKTIKVSAGDATILKE